MNTQTTDTIIAQLRDAQERALKVNHDIDLAAALYSIRRAVATHSAGTFCGDY